MNDRCPPEPLSSSVAPMNLTALDWELHEGLAVRREEAVALAAREHLVRELRAARRREESAARRREGGAPRRWWHRRG